MPLFKVDIEKSFENEFWTNVYYIEAETLPQAATDAQVFVSAERAFHKNQVLFTRVRTSTLAEGDNQFVTVPINLPGTGGNISDHLPLFNVVRVDLGDAGFSRPERKYYRVPLNEGDTNNGFLVDDMINQVVAALAPLTDVPEGVRWVGPSGELINAVAVNPRVGMRQLRRGSKRRTRPIIP